MTPGRADWERRHEGRHVAGDDHAPDAAPSDFLLAQAACIHGRVLDVAAGAGHNALFLARLGHVVEAIDIAHSGLRQLRARACASGLRVLTVQADLETFPLPRDRYDAVINFRYLQRSLLEPLQRALKPGGVIVFETFLLDQRTIGHPRNPDYLLRRGELQMAFAGCEILVYEEGLFASTTQPTYLARMVARRRRD